MLLLAYCYLLHPVVVHHHLHRAKSIEIIEEDINEAGDQATIKIKVLFGNGEEDISTSLFIIEDGKWKLQTK